MAQRLPVAPPTFKTYLLSFGPNENFALHSVCAPAKLFVGFWGAYKPGDFESKSFSVSLWDTDELGTPLSSNWKSAACPIKYSDEYEKNLKYFLRNKKALFDEERRVCAPNLAAGAAKPKKQAIPFILPTSAFFGAASPDQNGFGHGRDSGPVRGTSAEYATSVSTGGFGNTANSAAPTEHAAATATGDDGTDNISTTVHNVASGRALDSRAVVVSKRTGAAKQQLRGGPDDPVVISDDEQPRADDEQPTKLSSSWLCATATGPDAGVPKPSSKPRVKAAATPRKRGPAKPKSKPTKATKQKPAAKRPKKLPSSSEESNDDEEHGEELVSEDEHSSWYGSPTPSDKEFIEDDQPSTSHQEEDENSDDQPLSDSGAERHFLRSADLHFGKRRAAIEWKKERRRRQLALKKAYDDAAVEHANSRKKLLATIDRYRCMVCGIRFDDVWKLDRHLLGVHGLAPEVVEALAISKNALCDLCKADCGSVYNLHMHLHSAHANQGPKRAGPLDDEQRANIHAQRKAGLLLQQLAVCAQFPHSVEEDESEDEDDASDINMLNYYPGRMATPDDAERPFGSIATRFSPFAGAAGWPQ